MLSVFRVSGLAATLAFVFSLAAVPQISAQSTQAHIYVQSGGNSGPVYGYTALSNGQFPAISGSPFKPGTKIVGGTGSKFFTVGKTLLHSYAVGSNGALGSQLSQVGFFNYAGGSCGNSADPVGPQAVLDHTGKTVYVLLQGGGGQLCTTYQTYNVNSDGSFTFNGDSQVSVESGGYTTVPSILGNETFAYADSFLPFNNQVIGFRRESSGTLQYTGLVNPTFSGNAGYVSYRPDASPTENFVVLREVPNDTGYPQLGSFSVGSNGALTSTNTSANMPQTNLQVTESAFSPDGVFYAVAGDNGQNQPGSGLKLYQFNGASPLTLISYTVYDPIDQIAWDTSGHLYAVSTIENKLFIYTVLSQGGMVRSATYSIPGPVNLAVVSTAAASCGESTVNAVNVCSPTENSTVSSPVQINAAANMDGGVYRFELWSGSTKLINVRYSGIMNQPLTLAPGTYHLTFVAVNTIGTKATATRDITVK
jgi:hypothetical protein